MEDEGDDHEDYHWHHARANEGKGVGREGNRRALGEPFGKAAGCHHHAERGNEGRDFCIGNQPAIDKARTSPDNQPYGDRNENRQVNQSREENAIQAIICGLGKRHGHHRHGPDKGTGGEVDAASDDDLGYADCDDADHRHLQDHDFQAGNVAEEGLALENPAEHFEQDSDTEQDQANIHLWSEFAAFGCGFCRCDICV